MPRINAATVDDHRRATRRALLEGALDLFGRLGYANTTLGDIADHAAIGRTTFYDYFASKEDLLASLVEEMLPDMFDRLLDGVPDDLPAPERLGALVVAMVEFVATDPVFGLTLHRDLPRLSLETQRRVGATHRRLTAEFSQIFAEGVSEGQFRAVPVELAGHFMLDVVMSGARSVFSSAEPKQRFHEVADETVRFLIGGLSAGR